MQYFGNNFISFSGIPNHEWGKPIVKRIKGQKIDLMKLPQDAFFVNECSM